MSKNRRIQRLIILFCCNLIFTIHSQAQNYKLRVGIILPLTGDAVSVGNSIKNGMELALNQLAPNIRESLQISYEDDALEPRNTISAYKNLKQKGIDVLVTASSGCSNAVSPIVDRDQIPTIAIATDPAVVKNRNWVVNLYTSDVAEGSLALREARKRGYKNIARIIGIQDFMLAVKKSFDEANQGEIKFPIDKEISIKDRDFKTLTTLIRSRSDIDAVLLGVFPGQLGIFAKQLRASGVNAPLFGFETLEDANEVKISEGALLDSWYVNSDDPNQEFINKYSSTYPGESMYGSANGYDAIALIAKAAEAQMDKAATNQLLHNIKDFKGALGTYSSTGDNRFTLPAAIKVITKDGFQIIAR